MNALEEIQELKKYIKTLEDRIGGVESKYCCIELDQQKILKTNGKSIKPGVFTKVAIDGSGLVINGSYLEPADIPTIPITSVSGLEEQLARGLLIIDNFKKELMAENTTQPRFQSKGTGIRINYDEYGCVESAAELLASDVPELPIDKISGLDTRLQMVDDQLQSLCTPAEKVAIVNPGSYTKVTVDNQGRVTKGTSLTVTDIPVDIINRIATVENLVSTTVTSNEINLIKQQLLDKMDSIGDVASGSYCKVVVNSSGLVTSGSQLSMADLPNELITSIKELKQLVSSKAEVSELTSIHNSIASVAANTTTVSITQLQDHLTRIESTLKSDINSLKQQLSTLQKSTSGEEDQLQMKELMSQISLVSSKLSVSEK